jgi:HEAT repeat protein
LDLRALYSGKGIPAFHHVESTLVWLWSAWFDDERDELVVVDAFEGIRVVPCNTAVSPREGGSDEVLRALSNPSRDACSIGLQLALRYPLKDPGPLMAVPAASPDLELSVRAVVAQAAYGDEAACKRLVELLTGPKALGGPETVAAFEGRGPARDRALQELNVVDYAIEKLPRVLGAKAAPVLRTLVAKYTADAATRAFAALGKDGLSVLGEMILDASADQRQVAVEALGEIGDRGALPMLLKATKDAQAPVSHRAGRSLQKICGVNLAAELISMLQSGSPDADAILGYFCRHKHPPVVPVLIDFLGRATDKEAVRASLRFQTDQDFGTDPEAWKRGLEGK